MSKYTYRIMHLPIKRYLKWWLEKFAQSKEVDYNKTFYLGKTEQYSTTGSQLFNASLIPSSTNIVIEDEGKTIKMPVASSGNGYTTTNKKLSALCPNLAVGDTVYLLFTRNLGTSNNNFIYLTDYGNTWSNGTSLTITQSMLNSDVVLYANKYTSGETTQCILTDFRIVKNSTDTWEPYTRWTSKSFSKLSMVYY